MDSGNVQILSPFSHHSLTILSPFYHLCRTALSIYATAGSCNRYSGNICVDPVVTDPISYSGNQHPVSTCVYLQQSLCAGAVCFKIATAGRCRRIHTHTMITDFINALPSLADWTLLTLLTSALTVVLAPLALLSRIHRFRLSVMRQLRTLLLVMSGVVLGFAVCKYSHYDHTQEIQSRVGTVSLHSIGHLAAATTSLAPRSDRLDLAAHAPGVMVKSEDRHAL